MKTMAWLSSLPLVFAAAIMGPTAFHMALPDPVPPTPSLSSCYNRAANAFRPDLWNDKNPGASVYETSHSVQFSSNCYAYARNTKITDPNDIFSTQPGGSSGHPTSSLLWTTKEDVARGAVIDGLIPYDGTEPVPCGHYLVAFFVRPGFFGDYHWYRLDKAADGSRFWTHKPGVNQATDRDWDGNPIADLSKAALNPFYPVWGGYYTVPQTAAAQLSAPAV